VIRHLPLPRAIASSAFAALALMLLLLMGRAHAQGYYVSDFDQDILLARKNLDRFYGNEMRAGFYTAPGVSWINLAGGTASAYGNLNVEEGRKRAVSYCADDKVVYLNYEFLQRMNADFGYDGIMAILAHEFGHHVQNLLGDGEFGTAPKELQADCLSGVAMRWMTTGFPSLDRARLSYMAWWSGDDGVLPTGYAHGSGVQRQNAWDGGWSIYQQSRQGLLGGVSTIGECRRRFPA
jgi:hypothetical protein